ncbi:hypothetical protein [Kibdelosporangium aridum]|uniref:Uncharacterized protein n=1 Tax=Kibdelosporangium aridum TaxID=2030 RepID=A0A1W2FHE0_KIBAR|nr:hypothetical protein [Kibdelosporangium aridum]SMD21082.1 hypothetical protein SAMN05661093_06723 [Kibdelosporangium aridum]
MGLDAFVMCRCWQDGLATPPPIPAEWLRVENSMFEIVDEHDTLENSMAVDRWQYDACPHPNMEAAEERVANWSAYRLFQTALKHVGWQHFPALKANLPEANGGQMPAAAAAVVLDELAYFNAQPQVGEETRLVNEDTAATVMVYVPSYDGVVCQGPGYRSGVTPSGFFLQVDGQPKFRTARFEQIVENGRATLTDGERSVVWPDKPFTGQRFAVASRTLTPAYFEPIVESLRILCEVSVATGNPVAWT